MELSKSKGPNVSALACPECGAPMYPDMEKGVFSCLYCDTFRPFAITDEDFAPAIKFRHQPVKIVDGLLVAIEVKEALDPPPREERLKRLLPIDRKLLERDAEAFYALQDKTVFGLNCPFCGNHLTALLAESLFTCPYCGQKFGQHEQISTGKYDERLVVGRKYNLYSKCLPFKLSKPAAQISAKEILKDLIQNTSHVNDRLTAAYVPIQLADLRWKVKVSCERGDFWYYQECLDWAWPRSIIYDIFLMDELSPWDYGEITSLKPAYLEGKVQLLASENLGDWQARIPDCDERADRESCSANYHRKRRIHPHHRALYETIFVPGIHHALPAHPHSLRKISLPARTVDLIRSIDATLENQRFPRSSLSSKLKAITAKRRPHISATAF